MNRKKKIFLANVFIIITILILSPVIDSISINNAKIDTKNDSEPPILEIYVGNMTISCKGDDSPATVISNSKNLITIPVPLSSLSEGVHVTLKANYSINCGGSNDHGYVSFNVTFKDLPKNLTIYENQSTNDGVSKQGSFDATKFYCKPGQIIITWPLTSLYFYKLSEPENYKIDTATGSGICSFSHPYSNVQKSPLASKLLNLFFNRHIIMRGKIIFT